MVNLDFTRVSIETGVISKLAQFTITTLSINGQSTRLIGFLGNSVFSRFVYLTLRRKRLFYFYFTFSFSHQTSLSFVLYLLPNMDSGLRSSYQYVFVSQLVSQTGISE